MRMSMSVNRWARWAEHRWRLYCSIRDNPNTNEKYVECWYCFFFCRICFTLVSLPNDFQSVGALSLLAWVKCVNLQIKFLFELVEAKRWNERTNAYALKQYLLEYKLIMCVHRCCVPRLWLNNCLKEIFRFSSFAQCRRLVRLYIFFLCFALLFFSLLHLLLLSIFNHCSFLMNTGHTISM